MLHCIAVPNLKESDRIWESYSQNTTQKQPKIQLSAATKTFKKL